MDGSVVRSVGGSMKSGNKVSRGGGTVAGTVAGTISWGAVSTSGLVGSASTVGTIAVAFGGSD